MVTVGPSETTVLSYSHCWYNYIKILRYWHHCLFSPYDLCGQSKWTWTSKVQIPLAVRLLVQVVLFGRWEFIGVIKYFCLSVENAVLLNDFIVKTNVVCIKLLRVSTRSGHQQQHVRGG